jgi:hypothetical protein
VSYIYIRNKGGLGNQLFILNFGLLLSNKYKKKLIVDNSTGFIFDKYGRKPIINKLLGKSVIEATFFQKLIFFIIKKLPKNVINIFKIETLIESQSSIYINIDKLFFPTYKYLFVEGYFQSFQYLTDNISHIQNLFIENKVFNEVYNDFNNKIINSNSVCIHVRRKSYDNLLSDLYYNKAIEIIKSKISNPIFFIFSDSLEWCKSHFNNQNIVFIENPIITDDIQEFFLMKNCQNFIIANSTFSWWAALMSKNYNKFVIAPEKNQLGVIETFYPEDWILI